MNKHGHIDTRPAHLSITLLTYTPTFPFREAEDVTCELGAEDGRLRMCAGVPRAH